MLAENMPTKFNDSQSLTFVCRLVTGIVHSETFPNEMFEGYLSHVRI